MSDTWQIAKQRRRVLRSGPRRAYVSLNKRGEIAMNAEAFRRIREPANVTLLYDAPTGRIGVKYPVSLDLNFFPVRKYGRGRRMRIVRAARLLKQFDLKVDRTVICKNAEIRSLDGYPMLILKLDEG